jgi:hypothetical protein
MALELKLVPRHLAHDFEIRQACGQSFKKLRVLFTKALPGGFFGRFGHKSFSVFMVIGGTDRTEERKTTSQECFPIYPEKYSHSRVHVRRE